MARPMYSFSSSKRTLTSCRPFGSARHFMKPVQSSSFWRVGPPLLPQANSPKPSVIMVCALRPSFSPRISPGSLLFCESAGDAASATDTAAPIVHAAFALPLMPGPSFRLHRLALPGLLAPEVDAVLVGRGTVADHAGEQKFHHRVDLALLQRLRRHRRHVLAEIGFRVVVAALVGVGELVVIGHAGGRPAAADHLGDLLLRELRLAKRQRVAAVALIAAAVPLMTVLALRLVLENLLAEFDRAQLFGGQFLLRLLLGAG